MPWLNKRWLSFFIFAAAVGVILVSVTGWANNQEANKVKNQLNSFGTDPKGDISNPNLGTNWTNSDEILAGVATVNSFDPNSKTGPTLTLTLSFGGIVNQSASATLPDPIQIDIQKTTNFSANQDIPDQAISLNAPGNPNNFPFDTYEATLFLSASILPSGNDLPLTIFIIGDVQGFIYTTQFQSLGNNDGSSIQMTVDIQRSATTKIFAVVIFILMWCLSLSVFIAAMSVTFREKKAELPLVSISTALLFALPNIRNSQPGVPTPVGTTEDMVGFFWNILLVAVSSITLLGKWVMQNKRPPPTPVVDPENGEKEKGGK